MTEVIAQQNESKEDNKQSAPSRMDKQKLIELKNAMDALKLGETEAKEMRRGTLFQLPKHLAEDDKLGAGRSHHNKSNSSLSKARSKDRQSGRHKAGSKMSQNTSSQEGLRQGGSRQFIIKDKKNGGGTTKNKKGDASGKVQFEKFGSVEQVEETKSASANSIITESITDVNESDFDEAANQALFGTREKRKRIEEQYGYDTKRLNRIKCRKEEELIEHNYGIDFSKLKDSEIEMVNLRKYLLKWQKELHKHVDKGTAPVFGYPPICYSPTGYNGERV